MMRIIFTVYILSLLATTSKAQRNNYWAFGDSVGINFNTNPPTIDTTIIMMPIEPSASIADENGNLLFYVGSKTIDNFATKSFVVRNSLDSIMVNGDSLNGNTSMTQGLLIIPDPYDTALYYVFHNGWGYLDYSIVDMSLNGGLGAVISKNNFLKSPIREKLHAVKAANGKDWWIVGTFEQNGSDYFYEYKIDSTGLNFKGQFYINTPVISLTAGQLIFSPDGSKLINAGGYQLNNYLIDFDRCTGLFANINYIYNSNTKVSYGASFSPSGRFAYISTFDSLYQFDTQAANIATSRQLIYADSSSTFGMGQHMLAPDGNIYISNESTSISANNDSLATHLSRINYPDSIGMSCAFLPYSFSLNNRKSLLGLPNFPNYYLGQLEGVNCDSILALEVSDLNPFLVRTYPNPASEMVTIAIPENQKPEAKICIYDMAGKKLVEQEYKEQMDVRYLKQGMYLIEVTSIKHHAFSKFIKQ